MSLREMTIQAKVHLVYKVGSDLPYPGGPLLVVRQSLVINYMMPGSRTILGVSCLPHDSITSCINGVAIMDL